MSPTVFQRDLLSWYRRHRRALPWRGTRDPYRIWVSEVMLQQTTVRTVTPYYERFVERFPNVRALADASVDSVLAAWSGLGYYHRARNLHRGAAHVVARHAGRFPSSLEAALAIPGVGLYTASAVLSIAYGFPLPVVDGNVRRVLARVLALRGARWRKDGPYYDQAQELIDTASPGDWNQALMELGATVCTPRGPLCPICPVRKHCRARREGTQEEFPENRVRCETLDVRLQAALIEKGEQVLLVRRPEGPLMGGLWEIPQTSIESKEGNLAHAVARHHGLDIELGELLARVRHTITYRRIRAELYRCRLSGRAPRDGERFHWASPSDLERLPLSSLTHKLLRGARDLQRPLPLSRISEC